MVRPGQGGHNMSTFSHCLNASRDGEEVRCEDKSFHIHASVTGTAQRPTVESLTEGMDRLSLVEDQSLC